MTTARPTIIIATVEMVLACLAGFASLFAFFFAFISSDYIIMPYTEFHYQTAGKAVTTLWSYTPLALSLWIAARALQKNIPGKWFYQLTPPVTVALSVYIEKFWG